MAALGGLCVSVSGWPSAAAQQLPGAPVLPNGSGEAPNPGFQPGASMLLAGLPAPLRLSFSSSADGVRDEDDGLPEAPDPQSQAPGQPPADRAPSTKRILGVIPNFRTVSTDEHLPPQTVKQKFVTAAQDSFDYSSIFIPAALAGYSLGTTADPEFGGGGVGYARYLWHAVVDQTTENFLVEGILPSITHEDARFYTQGRGPAVERAGYALSRVLYTRSDAGLRVFNISEIVGSGASAGLSRLYYPPRERSFGNTGKQWGVDIGVDAISFMFKEFWPDVNQRLFGTQKTESAGKP